MLSTTRVGALLAAFACGLTPHPSPLAARALGFPRRVAPGEGEPLTSRALGFGRSATSVKPRRIGSGWQTDAWPWDNRTRRDDALIDLPPVPFHCIVAGGADVVSPPTEGFNLGPTVREVLHHIVNVRTDLVEIDFSLLVARNSPSPGRVGRSDTGRVIVELEVRDVGRRCSYIVGSVEAARGEDPLWERWKETRPLRAHILLPGRWPMEGEPQ